MREDLGAALVTPASTDPAQVEFVVEAGDTASTIAARLADEGLLVDPRTFVFIAIDQKLTGELQAGTFVLRKNMTPDQLVQALLAAPEIKYVDIGLRTGLRLEQITAKLADAAARHGSAGLLRPRQEADRRPCWPTTRGSRRSSRTRRRAPRSRASCGRRPIASCRTRRPRSSSG